MSAKQMGILIQEVVGRQRRRPWFFPAFAGVAFSRNEYRWSPRVTLRRRPASHGARASALAPWIVLSDDYRDPAGARQAAGAAS
jgi:hypothetical protein